MRDLEQQISKSIADVQRSMQEFKEIYRLEDAEYLRLLQEFDWHQFRKSITTQSKPH